LTNTFKIWLKAARLRTLPLAAGAILLGSFLAAYEYSFSWTIMILAFITAVLLQVLSNLANDYGDFQKGTDQAANRTDRSMASGNISEKAMKKALWVVGIATLIAGLALLYISLKRTDLTFFIWLAIGLLAIVAALKYTIGNNAYGYHGLGDLFVLLFFGPVAVAGTYFLMRGILPGNIWVPSFAFGFLCVAVLNINNLRDINHDKLAGKSTIAVRLGYQKTVWYQYGLFGVSVLLFMLFARLTESPYDHFVAVVFGISYYFITSKLTVASVEREKYNKALKQVSLTNLLFVIVLGVIWLV